MLTKLFPEGQVLFPKLFFNAHPNQSVRFTQVTGS